MHASHANRPSLRSVPRDAASFTETTITCESYRHSFASESGTRALLPPTLARPTMIRSPPRDRDTSPHQDSTGTARSGTPPPAHPPSLPRTKGTQSRSASTSLKRPMSRGEPGTYTDTPEGAHRDLTSDRGHRQGEAGGATALAQASSCTRMTSLDDADKLTPTKHLTPPPHHSGQSHAAETGVGLTLEQRLQASHRPALRSFFSSNAPTPRNTGASGVNGDCSAVNGGGSGVNGGDASRDAGGSGVNGGGSGVNGEGASRRTLRANGAFAANTAWGTRTRHSTGGGQRVTTEGVSVRHSTRGRQRVDTGGVSVSHSTGGGQRVDTGGVSVSAGGQRVNTGRVSVRHSTGGGQRVDTGEAHTARGAVLMRHSTGEGQRLNTVGVPGRRRSLPTTAAAVRLGAAELRRLTEDKVRVCICILDRRYVPVYKHNKETTRCTLESDRNPAQG